MLLRTQTRFVRFGVFEFDPASGDLWKGGRRIKLQNQPRQILKLLVSRPGELVTREELRRQLWPDDTFVDFNNGVNVAIRKIRDALGDVTLHRGSLRPNERWATASLRLSSTNPRRQTQRMPLQAAR